MDQFPLPCLVRHTLPMSEVASSERNARKPAVKYRTLTGILVAMVLALISLTPVTGYAQQQHGAGRDHQLDRDRTFDRDRRQDDRRVKTREQPRDWDRLNFPTPSKMKDQDIYGHEFMTIGERQQYRDRLGDLNTSQSRRKFQAKHEKMMRKRALLHGGDLIPPGQGPAYGGELMTVQERNRFREQLRLLDVGKARQKFLASHRHRMDERARALGYKIKEAK